MKTVSIRLTDKQHHYLAALARSESRSVEHMIWLGLASGIPYMFCEDTYFAEKLQCDFTEEEVEKMKQYPLMTPAYGTEYYDSHPWAESIGENVLDDCDRTFEEKDAAFDLKAEVERTAALHAKRKADHEAKEAAAKKQQEESK